MGDLFVIIIILAVGVIAIAGIGCFIGKFFDLIGNVWFSITHPASRIHAENIAYENEKQYKNANLGEYYSKNGYTTPPTVTGDHFDYSYESEHMISQKGSGLDEQYCIYRTSSNCANCIRREEHFKNGKYYYGPSKKCVKYRDMFDY